MKCEGELAKYAEMANKERVIVELSKILDLFNGKCQVEEWSAERKVVRHNVEGVGALRFVQMFTWKVFGIHRQFSQKIGAKRCL